MSSAPFLDLSQSLTDLCDAYRTCRLNAPPTLFAEGSPAAAESAAEPLAGAWGTTPTADANRAVLLSIEAMVDHLRGVATLLAGPSTMYAPFTAARSALEIAAQAWYLLEPGIGAEERALRGINMRLRSLWEQYLLPGFDPRPEAAAARKEALERIDGLLAAARSLNIRAAKGGGTRPPKVGNGLKSTLQVVESCVSAAFPTLGPLYWRYGSAIAHGQVHGMLSVYSPVGDAESELAGYSVMQMRLTAEQAALRAGGAVLASRSTLDRLCVHFGWDGSALRRQSHDTYLAWARIGKLDRP